MLIWCEHFLRRWLIDIWQHRRTAAPHGRRRNNNQMLSFSRTFLPKKIKPLALCYLNYLQGILGRACLSLSERGAVIEDTSHSGDPGLNLSQLLQGSLRISVCSSVAAGWKNSCFSGLLWWFGKLAYIKQKQSEIGVITLSRTWPLEATTQDEYPDSVLCKYGYVPRSLCSWHSYLELENADGMPASGGLMVKWDDTQYRCLGKHPTRATAYLRGL